MRVIKHYSSLVFAVVDFLPGLSLTAKSVRASHNSGGQENSNGNSK
jgi:hypothetical protein